MRNFVFYLAPLAAIAATPESSGVTFYREVQPIQARCQVCHRPGEAVTGSFLTYESTRPWARAINAAVPTPNRLQPDGALNGHDLHRKRHGHHTLRRRILLKVPFRILSVTALLLSGSRR
jgi:hypothetical protein